jgi:hypothetical protein
MNQLLNIIGTLASIGSIPLAIYLYLKSIENQKDRVRRDILRILSYQIGENRQLDTFEVSKVIRSNCRNNKISETSISIEVVLEDLVSETISNPLLQSNRKDEILLNIQNIFPNSIAQPISKTETEYSRVYLLTILLLLLIPLSVFVIVGENGWNSSLDWLMSFNTFKGFWANFLASILVSLIGGGITYIYARKKFRRKLTRDNRR